jgi:hypothetical protein
MTHKHLPMIFASPGLSSPLKCAAFGIYECYRPLYRSLPSQNDIVRWRSSVSIYCGLASRPNHCKANSKTEVNDGSHSYPVV